MNRRIIGLCLNKKTLMIYVLIWLIVLISSNTSNYGSNDLIVNIFGGIPLIDSVHSINIYRIILWNVCIIPPVAVSTLFALKEFGLLSIYTVIRYDSVRKWFFARLLPIIVVNYLYMIIGITMIVIFGIGEFHLGILTYCIIIIYPLYTLMISLLCIVGLIISRNPKVSLIIFFFITGISIILGTTITRLNKYMIGCYGMVLRSNLVDSSSGFNIIISIIVMMLIIIISILLIVRRIKKNNPACYSHII